MSLTFRHFRASVHVQPKVQFRQKDIFMAKVLYARVSTAQQHLDRQLIDSEQYDKIFIDKCSGKDTNRPQLQEMLNYLHEFDSLAVHELSRLGRNTFDLISLVKTILDKNVDIFFIKENLHFKPGNQDPISNLVLEVFSSIYSFERTLILERTREGRELAKAQGKYKGTKKHLNQAQIEELKDLAKNKAAWPVSTLCKRYNICRASVYNYLKI